MNPKRKARSARSQDNFPPPPMSSSSPSSQKSTSKLYKSLKPITIPASSPRASFRNWGQTFYCKPLVVFEPENEDQIALILELARREGKVVRAVGVGHSPSDLPCTSEFMVRMTKLNRILDVRPSSSLSSSSSYAPPSRSMSTKNTSPQKPVSLSTLSIPPSHSPISP